MSALKCNEATLTKEALRMVEGGWFMGLAYKEALAYVG